ncbi:MAG: hypothetical protein P8N02_13600, partial [Actinomycetota bacterium]|nr:hypothetical protein [Actinomycetota bacterium]
HLTLAVQNAADVADLGAATSSSNFFRALGATFGAAAAGSLVTARLADRLDDDLSAERLADLGGAEGLIRSPKAVKEFPEEVHEIVTGAVADAVSSIFLWIVPLMVLILLLGLTIEERPLRTGSAIGGADKPAGEG